LNAIKDGSLMEIIYTYADPGSVTRPISFARILQRGATRQTQEAICGENNWELEGIYKGSIPDAAFCLDDAPRIDYATRSDRWRHRNGLLVSFAD
jgi:hypothetical protein